jgi:hypothetical protein
MKDEWLDGNFHKILYDEHGIPVKVLKEYTTKVDKSSGFTTYDTTYGHCALCGSIICKGNCFR